MSSDLFGLEHFVNRETERKRIREIFLKVVHNRKPAFMLIHGDYGIGKTTLVEAFLEEMEQKVSGVLIGRGKCAAEHQGNGLLPFAQVLNGLAGANRQERVEVGSALEFLGKIAPAWVDIFTSGAATALQQTIKESRKYFGQNYDFSAQNVQAQYAKALEKVTEKRPAIAFVDDFHWADPSSISLLNFLASNFHNGAVLFIITYRSVEGTELRETAPFFREVIANQQIRQVFTEIELTEGIPLRPYVDKRYPGNDFSPALLKRIQDYTEGHPQWIAQLFKFWEETGVIKAERLMGGKILWSLPDAENLDLENLQPDGSDQGKLIWRVLEERMRLLDPAMQDLLTYAAVQGEYFSVQVLSRQSGLSEEQIFKWIARLERDFHLIAAHETQEYASQILDVYRFSPRNVRQVIYQRMPSGQRRLLHQRVASCLEEIDHDLGGVSAQICQHFKNAKVVFKAAQYALRAARYEQSHSSFKEGENWCQEGLALLESLPERPEHLALKADLLQVSADGFLDGGSFTRAEERYCQALDLADAIGMPAERMAQICVNLSHACRYEGQIERGLGYIARGKQTLLEKKVPFGEAYLALDVNSIFLQRDNSELALYSFTKLLEYAETLPATSTLDLIKAFTYNWLGVIQSDHLNRFEDAARSYKQAIAYGQKCGVVYIQIMSMLNMADDYAKLHHVEDSQHFVDRAWDLAVQIGDLDDQSFALGTQAIIHNLRGDYAQAVDAIYAAIEISTQIGSHWNLGYLYTDLSTAYLGLGELAKAEEAAQKAVESSTEGNIQLGYALFALAQVESRQGAYSAAQNHYEECSARFRAAGSVLNLARVQTRQAEDLLRLGKKEQAARLLEEAIPVLNHYELKPEADAAQALYQQAQASGEPI